MLRRRKSDAPFLRENLVAALKDGAACEVDIAFTADGHALCLHDPTLDRETTGRGLVAATARSQIERVLQRGSDGSALCSAPLFLDEIVATVRQIGATLPALVQLDVKTPAGDLDPSWLTRIAGVLGESAPAFIASGYDWETVRRLAAAAPGMHTGFDPLLFYPRSCDLDATAFGALAARTLATASGASVYYLEARLVLAALDRGVDLVAAVTGAGARVDAWTIDADLPDLRDVLRRLIAAGCHQLTSNDPEALRPIVEEVALCS
jgi:glycerophosphoryl diester phosphodiesterase